MPTSGEPEAMLLDEVEGEAVAPRRPWRDDGDLERDRSPGSTTGANAVRGPSHTIALPSGSSQWYESWTPSRPRDRQVAEPAFSSRTRAFPETPARGSSSS